LNIISPKNVFTLDISLLREKPSEVSDSISKFIKVNSSPRNINCPTFINRDKVSFFTKDWRLSLKKTWSQIFENASKIPKKSNKNSLKTNKNLNVLNLLICEIIYKRMIRNA
tara:strand:+ start:1853 stop:2188 length:336 start_codon:yes stop_codon:yes gene_type:complete